MISTGIVRAELATLHPNGVICDGVWKKLRAAAGVRGNKVDRDGWVRLCAAFAMHKAGQRPINPMSVNVFIRKNGLDPLAFLPGLMPLEAPSQLAGDCLGSDLPKLFKEWLGVHRCQNTIRNWCLAAGLEFSEGVEYSKDEIKLILHAYAKAQTNRRRVALQNLGVKQ